MPTIMRVEGRREGGRRRELKRGGTGYPMGSQRRRPSRISAKAENMVAKNTEGVCDRRHGSAQATVSETRWCGKR